MTGEKILAMIDSYSLGISCTREFSLFIQCRTCSRPDWFWYTALSPFIFFLNVWSTGPLHILFLYTNYWFLSNFIISRSRQFFCRVGFFFSSLLSNSVPTTHMDRQILRKGNRKGSVNIHVVIVVLDSKPKQSITKSSSNVLSPDWRWMF